MTIDKSTLIMLEKIALSENITVTAALSAAVKDYYARRTRFYTVNDAAQALHLTPATIRHRIKHGMMTAAMKNGRYYIPQSELNAPPVAIYAGKRGKSPKEYAGEMGVSVATVYYWISTGKIKATRTGERGHLRIIEELKG